MLGAVRISPTRQRRAVRSCNDYESVHCMLLPGFEATQVRLWKGTSKRLCLTGVDQVLHGAGVCSIAEKTDFNGAKDRSTAAFHDEAEDRPI